MLEDIKKDNSQPLSFMIVKSVKDRNKFLKAARYKIKAKIEALYMKKNYKALSMNYPFLNKLILVVKRILRLLNEQSNIMEMIVSKIDTLHKVTTKKIQTSKKRYYNLKHWC